MGKSVEGKPNEEKSKCNCYLIGGVKKCAFTAGTIQLLITVYITYNMYSHLSLVYAHVQIL